MPSKNSHQCSQQKTERCTAREKKENTPLICLLSEVFEWCSSSQNQLLGKDQPETPSQKRKVPQFSHFLRVIPVRAPPEHPPKLSSSILREQALLNLVFLAVSSAPKASHYKQLLLCLFNAPIHSHNIVCLAPLLGKQNIRGKESSPFYGDFISQL